MKIKNFQDAKNLRFLSMFRSKKGFIMSPGDFIKGLIIGIIIGGVVIYLGSKGVIPIPFL
jgi:hypothetical protein